MLRINLLPTYVSQRRLTRKLFLGFIPLLVLCVAIPMVLYLNASRQAADMANKATAAEAGKAITDQLKSTATSTTAQIAPIQTKVDFVNAVHQHNTDIVKFWNTLAAYADPRVIYSDAVISGSTLTIKAYSPSIAEVSVFLQRMYKEPDLQSVSIDKLPGYREAVVNKLYLRDKRTHGTDLFGYETFSGGSATGGGGPAASAGLGRSGASGPGGRPTGPAGGGGGRNGGFSGSSTGGPNYFVPEPFQTELGEFSDRSDFEILINGPYSNDTSGSSIDFGPSIAGSQMPFYENMLQPSLGLQNPDLKHGPVRGLGDTHARSDRFNSARIASDLGSVQPSPFATNEQRQEVARLLRRTLGKKIIIQPESLGFPITITATLKNPLTVPTVPGSAAAATGPGGFGPQDRAG